MVLDYIFERLTGKHCDGSDYGQFFSLADAKEACRNDPKCGKVYDQGCNGSPYSLCPVYAQNKDSGRSCLYIKPKYGKYTYCYQLFSLEKKFKRNQHRNILCFIQYS